MTPDPTATEGEDAKGEGGNAAAMRFRGYGGVALLAQVLYLYDGLVHQVSCSTGVPPLVVSLDAMATANRLMQHADRRSQIFGFQPEPNPPPSRDFPSDTEIG